MDRISMKQDAKLAMKQASASPYICTLIVLVISLIFSSISFGRQVMTLAIDSGNLSSSDSGVASLVSFGVILSLLTTIISVVINIGYYKFCLKVSRRDTTASYGDLFSFFKYVLKVIGLMIMMNIFITLWTLLLIVPGIIASYRYSQAYFILAEDPSKGVMQCIRESKEMMVGNKMDYFVLQLSFIGWSLLAAFTCMIGYLYVMPYMTVTMANFYNQVSKYQGQVVDASFSEV